jgi:hypothetical protein
MDTGIGIEPMGCRRDTLLAKQPAVVAIGEAHSNIEILQPGRGFLGPVDENGSGLLLQVVGKPVQFECGETADREIASEQGL